MEFLQEVAQPEHFVEELYGIVLYSGGIVCDALYTV
jgi:hypothetical protein